MEPGGVGREFVGCEVGLAIGMTSTTGANVLAVLREVDRVSLTQEQRQAVA